MSRGGAFAVFAQETDWCLPDQLELMFYVSLPFYDKITVADVQLHGLLAQTTQFRMGSSEGVVTTGLWSSFQFLL